MAPVTTLGEANEQLRADMRVMYWSQSTRLQVKAVTDVEGGELVQQYVFVVHVEPEFVGPRCDGVPPPHAGRRVRRTNGMGGGAGQLLHLQPAPVAQQIQEEEVNLCEGGE